MTYSLKLRSNGLSFHRFRPRFMLFPVVGMGRIYVACGLVSAFLVSHIVTVNSLHIKRPDCAILAKSSAIGTAYLFEFHRPQSTSANLEALEVWPSYTPF
ncbi:hypothetical protein AVEN_131225-1 [Araneus ventricosus]|uniref:Uncharacterized protein n=1 Tax=Araneus ventricosus TaxID=182803 RepID=A0A4Y2IRR1_ARAVE|nr:hypothetical protein AVEN_131225-1 [Araneus ventricosus]